MFSVQLFGSGQWSGEYPGGRSRTHRLHHPCRGSILPVQRPRVDTRGYILVTPPGVEAFLHQLLLPDSALPSPNSSPFPSLEMEHSFPASAWLLERRRGRHWMFLSSRCPPPTPAGVTDHSHGCKPVVLFPHPRAPVAGDRGRRTSPNLTLLSSTPLPTIRRGPVQGVGPALCMRPAFALHLDFGRDPLLGMSFSSCSSDRSAPAPSLLRASVPTARFPHENVKGQASAPIHRRSPSTRPEGAQTGSRPTRLSCSALLGFV